jgi:probable selenium-dependent hydroxylase accessory protein YqeC
MVLKCLGGEFFGQLPKAILEGRMLFSKALPLAPGTVVSVIGGGGKTGLIELWEGELFEAGVKAITTFTTRLERNRLPELRKVRAKTFGEALGAVYGAKKGERLLLCGPKRDEENGEISEAEGDKIWSIPVSWLDRLVMESGGELTWLIEADGSAGRPIKIHREWEPVLPTGPSFVVLVMGLSALVRPWTECVHKPEGLGRYLEPPAGDRPLRPEEIAKFAAKAYQGLNVGAIFLNQEDALADALADEMADGMADASPRLSPKALGESLGRGLVGAGFRVIYGSLRERKFTELMG